MRSGKLRRKRNCRRAAAVYYRRRGRVKCKKGREHKFLPLGFSGADKAVRSRCISVRRGLCREKAVRRDGALPAAGRLTAEGGRDAKKRSAAAFLHKK